SSTNSFNTVSTPVNTAGASRIFGDAGSSFVPLSKFTNLPDDPLMPDLEDTAKVQNTSIFGSAYDDDDFDTYNYPYADQVMGAEADFNNMEPSTIVSPIPAIRVYSIHPKDQIIRDPRSLVQTRGITKKSFREHAMISYIQKQRWSNHKDFQNCLFACFLSQQEPTKIAQALDDESWVEAMQEELLQFKIQKRRYMLKVYKVEKALYGLHKAPRAWYETLSTYLLDNGFYRRQIDKTLFRANNAQKVPDEFNGRAHFLLRFTSQPEREWDLH
ncbi:putative ribonuclease H-like domain-containing protein, partial [Tanacetum coccineum]